LSEKTIALVWLGFRLLLISFSIRYGVFLDALLCVLLLSRVIVPRQLNLILLLLSSMLIQAADPAFGVFAAIWFSLIPACFLIQRTPRLRSLFGYGLFLGLLVSMGIFSWLYEAMVVFWEVPGLLALPVFGLLVFLLALPYGVFTLLTGMIHSRTDIPLGFVAAVVFALVEFWTPYPVKGQWALAQTWVPALIQVSDLAGMPGVTLLLALVNGLLFESVRAMWQKPRSRAARLAMVAVCILLAQVIYGLWCLQAYEPHQSDPSIRVAMIQPVSPLKVLNSDGETKKEIADTLLALSLAAVTQFDSTPDLLIWPEGAAPVSYQSPAFNSEFIDVIRDFHARSPVPLFIQDIEFPNVSREPHERIRYYNHTSLIQSDGTLQAGYRKNCLLPMAEYLPWERSLPLLRKCFPQTRSLLPGTEMKLIEGVGSPFVPLVCYELVFSDFVRRFVRKGGTYIVNVTNDRWYGVDQQPYQHLAYAVFRAVENRRPVVRATNSGISAFVDSRGVIRKGERTHIMQRTALSATVYPSNTKSFYSRYGDLILKWGVTPLVLIVFTLRLRIAKKAKAKGIS